MTIREIAETLDATWLCCEEEGDRALRTAFASDMMSDVLACVTEDTLLLTGLVNGQCVRTCEMLDVPCVVFVRSKEPLADALALAREIDLPILRKTVYSRPEAGGAGVKRWSFRRAIRFRRTI